MRYNERFIQDYPASSVMSRHPTAVPPPSVPSLLSNLGLVASIEERASEGRCWEEEEEACVCGRVDHTVLQPQARNVRFQRTSHPLMLMTKGV